MQAVAPPSASSPATPLEAGTMVDHFRVARTLGRGAAGVVYVARDTKLGRKVALKVVAPDTVGDDDTREAFLREARITATFNHPNIVTIYAVGEHRGAPYLALEYLDGQTLFERTATERPSPLEVARYGLAIARALAEAHAHDVLHRDLKPENVYIARDGRLRVLDFGVARLGQRNETTRLPLSLVGTPAYVAPELWEGDPPSAASDVWSLGVTLYEMLAGHPPFEADSLGDLAELMADDEPDLEALDGPEALRELVAHCLDKDPASRPPAQEIAERLDGIIDPRRPLADVAPFRGLLPFDEEHAHLFFGRDAEIASAVERLRGTAVMAVVGPSGAGKSSFVSAGVLPRLREQTSWEVIRLRPGRHPMARLTGRLRSTFGEGSDASLSVDALRRTPSLLALELQRRAEASGGRVLLFVDQLEEVYSLGADPDERRAFVEAILGAADDADGPVRVIVTLRDDFLGRVAEGVVRDALSQILILRSPRAEQLVELLTRPLERVGYRFEDPELVEEIVDTLEGEPGCLPLLSFACAALWEREQERPGSERRLTREAYDAIGGVGGALAQHAEEQLHGLTAEERDVARRLLLRLVTPERTRRVVTREDLLEGLPASAGSVVARFVEGRALVVRKGRDGPAELELAHESLITRWSRLARWIDESHDEVAFLAELGEVAHGWDRRGRHPEEAWQGRMLDDALLRARRCESLPERIDAFLQAGVSQRGRAQRRRRALVLGALAVLAVATIVLFTKEREAQDARQRAEDQKSVAEQERAVAQREGAEAALGRGDLAEARAKLRGSFEAEDSLQARGLWWRIRDARLHWRKKLPGFAYALSLGADSIAVGVEMTVQVVQRDTLATRVLRGSRHHVVSVAQAPEGGAIAGGNAGGQLLVWPSDGEPRIVDAHRGTVRDVAYSPDGRWLATASEDGTVGLFSADDPATRHVLGEEGTGMIAVGFSPSGELLASGGVDGDIHLWDVRRRERLRVLRGHSGQVHGLDFSADGAQLVSASFDGSAALWDPSTGKRMRRLVVSSGAVSAAFDRAGHRFAVGTRHGEVYVVEGARVDRFHAHDSGVFDLAFSADATRLYTSSNDRTLKAWRLDERIKETRLEGHRGPILGLVWSPDGATVATASDDHRIMLWNAATGVLDGTLTGHENWVRGLDISPDGRLIASASRDLTVRVWDLATRQEVALLQGHRLEPHLVAFIGNGRLVSVGNGSEVYFWDLATGSGENVASGAPSRRSGLAVSPDDAIVAVGRTDGGIELLDAVSGAPRDLLVGHERKASGLAFSADGTLWSSGWDHSVRRWDTATGKSTLLRQSSWRHHRVAVTGNGKRVAVGSSNGLGYLRLDGRWRELTGHRAEVNNVAFSPDGKRLATVSDDATLRLWEASTGRRLWRTLAVLRQPMAVLTHRGWSQDPPTGAWVERLSASHRSDHAAQAHRICIVTDDGLELWDTAADRRLAAIPRRARHVFANAQGCLAVDEGVAQFVAADGTSRALMDGVTAASSTEEGFLLAVPGAVNRLDANGETVTTLAVEGEVAAVGFVEDRLVLGYADGGVEMRTSDATTAFGATPSAAPVLLRRGPPGTVLAGFADGTHGLWSLADGAPLLERRMHGAIVDAVFEGRSMTVVSDLGQTLTTDLDVFHRDYCEQLAVMWREVNTLWQDGAIVKQPPPQAHRCPR